MRHESELSLERWLRLMGAWDFEPGRETFDSLRAAYSGKGRHYHTAAHIAACLKHLERCSVRLTFPREVEIALWFHDAVYKPLSGDNERKSAEWAASFLSERGAAGAEVTRVHHLIMATEHNAPAHTDDEAVLVDIDLAILGTDSATYDTFESDVRKEYKLVPSFVYRKKRAEILRGFVERPKIYTSGCFPTTREQQARQNLSNAISALEKLA